MVRRRPDGARRRARGSRARLAGDHAGTCSGTTSPPTTPGSRRGAPSAGSGPTGAWRRRRRRCPRRVSPSTAWPSTSSPRLGSARTARSPCVTSPAGSGRRSSATTSRSASRAPSWSSIHPAAKRRAPLTSLAAAAAHVGVPLEVADEPLEVDEAASRFLGDWYGFAASVLEQLRAEAGPELEASRAQLWTEHFDLAVELGAKAAGARAGYGGSPGDERHSEPYLYVVPWEASRASGDGWNAAGYRRRRALVRRAARGPRPARGRARLLPRPPARAHDLARTADEVPGENGARALRDARGRLERVVHLIGAVTQPAAVRRRVVDE